MTKILRLKKLTKDELRKLATLFKGNREGLAHEAGVSIQTVHNTFQDKHQNEKVIEAAYRIVKKDMETPTDVDALKQILAVKTDA
jgi:hypothetical protein